MKRFIGALIITSIMLAAMVPVAFAQTGMACDAAGVEKYEFAPTDTVYATGSGFPLFNDVDIYVIADQVWSDGDPIPADISGGAETVNVGDTGNIPVTPVWVPPLSTGDFDIIFDCGESAYQPDGFYNAVPGMDRDFVDDVNPAGFIVRDPGGEPTGDNPAMGGPTVGGKVMLINKFELLTQYLNMPMRLMLGFGF